MNKEVKICFGLDVDCTNVNITWLSTPGLIVPCIEKNCITVAIDPNATGEKCIEGIITCLDANGNVSCKNCEPVHFKKCFCTTDVECGDCGTCGSDGLCEDTCTDIEKAQGKKCYTDGCKCPPHQVFDTKTQKCAECISGTVNPENPCLVCIDGSYVLKSCGDDSICDTTTGDCIPDCSLNANGQTYYNPITKKCECRPGYVLNANSKKCEPKLPDCPPGSERVLGSINCTPIPCPPGYVWSVADNDCIEAPCDATPCDNGTECDGVNCGCSKTKKVCVSCKEDPTALGCGSIDPPNGCDGTGFNCPPGSGCYQGGCVDCNNFTDEQKKLIPGCNPDQLPCPDKLTLEVDECTVKGELRKNSICQCEQIGSSAKVLTVVKQGEEDKEEFLVNLEVDLRKEFANNQNQYEATSRFTNQTINNELPISASTTIVLTTVYQDLETGLYYDDNNEILLSKDLSENAITETVVNFNNIKIGQNNIIRPLPTDEDQTIKGIEVKGYKINITISDIEFYNNCSYNSKVIYNSNSLQSVIPTITPRYFTISKLVSTSEKNPLFTIKIDDLVSRKFYVQPTSTNIYDDVLYGPKKYDNDAERGLQNLASPQGELLPLSKIELISDCTCDPIKTIDKLVMCDIEFEKDVHFIINASSITSSVCNNQIEIIDGFDLCDINKNLLDYGWDTTTAAARQTKYILKLNNNEVARFVYDNSVGQLVREVNGTLGTQTFVEFKANIAETITKVSLEMNHSNGCKKEVIIPTNNNNARIGTVCQDSETYTLTVSEIVGNPIKEIIFKGDTTTYVSNPISITQIPYELGAEDTVQVIFENNCKKTYPIVVNCCTKESLSVVGSPIVGSSQIILDINTTSQSILSTININGVNKSISSFTNNSNIYTTNYTPVVTASNITVQVQTISGCLYTEVIDIPSDIDATLELAASTICSNDDTQLTFTSDGGSVPVTITGPGNVEYQGSVSNGTLSFTVNDAGTYSVTSYNGVISNYGLSVVLEIADAPIVTSFIMEAGIYGIDDNIPFTVSGTPDAVITDIDCVNVTACPASITLDPDGNAAFTVSAISLGTMSVTLNEITLGTCPNAITPLVQSTTILAKHDPVDVVDITVYDSSTADPIIILTSSEGSVKVYSDSELTNLVYTGNTYQSVGSEILYARVEGGSKSPSNVVMFQISEVTITINNITLNAVDSGTVANICSGQNGTIGLDVSISGTGGFEIPTFATSDFIVDWFPQTALGGTQINNINSLTENYAFDDTAGSVRITLKDPNSTDIEYKAFSDSFNFTITENTGCDPCYYFGGGADLQNSVVAEGENALIDVTASGGTGPYNYVLKRFGSQIQTFSSASDTHTFTLTNVQFPGNEGQHDVTITDTSTGCMVTRSVNLGIAEGVITISEHQCGTGITVTATGNPEFDNNYPLVVWMDDVRVGYLKNAPVNQIEENPLVIPQNTPGTYKIEVGPATGAGVNDPVDTGAAFYTISNITVGTIDGAISQSCPSTIIDFVFIVDISKSVDVGTEYPAMESKINATIDEIDAIATAETLTVRYAMVQYDHNASLEYAFTSSAAAAKTYTRRADDGGTRTDDAFLFLKQQLDGDPAMALDGDLHVILFTDDKSKAEGGHPDRNSLVSAYGNKISVVGLNLATLEIPGMAAFATLGGSYTGTVKANGGDLEGNGTTPRRYYDEDFTGTAVPNLVDDSIQCKLSVTGAGVDAAYSWSGGDLAFPDVLTNSFVFVPYQDGVTYTVTITEGGCSKQLSIVNS